MSSSHRSSYSSYASSRHSRDDDEISLISMREVAPSPVEDDFDAPTPRDASPSKVDLTHISSSIASQNAPKSRNISFWLYRSQKYSAYAFTSFLGIHATTASLSPLIFGNDAGNSSLLLARTYFYQAHPIVEALLIPGSLLVHMGSGLALRAYRHHQQKQRYGGNPPESISMWRWRNFSWNSVTGYLAIPLLIAHGRLLRGVPLMVDGDSSQVQLEYLAHGFNVNWLAKTTGYTLYAAFVGLVSYHVVSGWARYMKVSPRKQRVTQGATIVVAGMWLSGLVSIVQRSGPVTGYLGRIYNNYYRVFFRAV